MNAFLIKKITLGERGEFLQDERNRLKVGPLNAYRKVMTEKNEVCERWKKISKRFVHCEREKDAIVTAKLGMRAKFSRKLIGGWHKLRQEKTWKKLRAGTDGPSQKY